MPWKVIEQEVKSRDEVSYTKCKQVKWAPKKDAQTGETAVGDDGKPQFFPIKGLILRINLSPSETPTQETLCWVIYSNMTKTYTMHYPDTIRKVRGTDPRTGLPGMVDKKFENKETGMGRKTFESFLQDDRRFAPLASEIMGLFDDKFAEIANKSEAKHLAAAA